MSRTTTTLLIVLVISSACATPAPHGTPSVPNDAVSVLPATPGGMTRVGQRPGARQVISPCLPESRYVARRDPASQAEIGIGIPAGKDAEFAPHLYAGYRCE